MSCRNRPSDVSDSARIVNYNVRGRRGNIVQAETTSLGIFMKHPCRKSFKVAFNSFKMSFNYFSLQVYPSVEYDFVPQDLTVETGDYLHFQWTGSDANPQGNTGNGRQGTDRSNLVQLSSRQDAVLSCHAHYHFRSNSYRMQYNTIDNRQVPLYCLPMLSYGLGECAAAVEPAHLVGV